LSIAAKPPLGIIPLEALTLNRNFQKVFTHQILQNDKNRWVQETVAAYIKKKRIEKCIGQPQEEIPLNSV